MIKLSFLGGVKSSNDDYWYCNKIWINMSSEHHKEGYT